MQGRASASFGSIAEAAATLPLRGGLPCGAVARRRSWTVTRMRSTACVMRW